MDFNRSYFHFSDAVLEQKIIHIRQLVTPILRFIPRNIPEFTDHGYLHSTGILKILSELIPIVNEHCSYDLDEEDVFLLEASAYLHDIGNIIGPREIHGETSAILIEQMLEKYTSEKFGFSQEEIYVLKVISWTHQGSTLRLLSMRNKMLKLKKEVDLGFVSALFRLTDALDIGSTRAPQIVYEIIEKELPDVSKRHWLAHQALFIRYPIAFDAEEKVILLFVFPEKRKDASFILEQLNNELRNCLVILDDYGFPFKEMCFATPDILKGRYS
jgi:hypothetical protein